MLNLEKYVRRPFYVTSVIVTSENMEEVAKWCGGEVLPEKQGKHTVKYVKVPVIRPMSDKQTKAYVHDRVLETKSGFKVYDEAAFQRSFQQAPFPVSPLTQTDKEIWVENDPQLQGQHPTLFELDEAIVIPRDGDDKTPDKCGNTRFTIDHKPCLLDKNHLPRPCTSILFQPAPANFPKKYPNPDPGPSVRNMQDK